MQTEPLAELESDAVSDLDAVDSRTAGDILAQERQRLGLNEKEVADQLHITMHYVKALESNNYEKLPGAVFAKGYLKSYAILLGLDVEDLLSRYDVINDRQQADIQEASRQVKARKKKDRNKPLVIVSLFVFVGGFLGLWVANSFFGTDVESGAPATVEVNDNAESNRPASSQQLASQPRLTLQAAPDEIEQATVESPLPPVIESQIQAGQSDSALSSEIPLIEIETVRAVAAADLDLQDIAAVLQAKEPESIATAASTAVSEPRVITIEALGDDVLRMSFSGESWVEVNDSESQQIYRDIREAGDVLEITGSAPFNILLGDAPFTRMSLNGDEIDLSSDIRIDNSARLTVGL